MTTVREDFETNTFGTIAMTQAVMPQFRQRKAGVVVNVTSSVTLKALPLLAARHASKAAVNAFTESMALEPFGVRAPGVSGPLARDTLRRERARQHAWHRSRSLCGLRAKSLRKIDRNLVPDHPCAG